MEVLKPVLEVLESGPDGVEALRLRHRRLVILRPESLHEHEAAATFSASSSVAAISCDPRLRLDLILRGFGKGSGGFEEMGPRYGVDGVADLVVEVTDPLQHRLHCPSHRS